MGYYKAWHQNTDSSAHRFLLEMMTLSYMWWWLCWGFVFVMTMVEGSKVKEPRYPEPKFLPRMVNVTVREGARAKLPCAVHFVGTRQVTWRKTGGQHFLTIGNFKWVKDDNIELETVQLTPEVMERNLIIHRVSKNDSGVYVCQISAGTTMSRQIQLNVVGPPLIPKGPTDSVVEISGKHYVERGHSIHLFCNTTAPEHVRKGKFDHTQLSVDWFKDGDNIKHSKYRHVIITNYYLVHLRKLVSELRIDRSGASDTGTYICRSPTDQIASHKVTVLFADTTNVKRDNTVIESSLSSSSSSSAISIYPPFYTIVYFGVVIAIIVNEIITTESSLYALPTAFISIRDTTRRLSMTIANTTDYSSCVDTSGQIHAAINKHNKLTDSRQRSQPLSPFTVSVEYSTIGLDPLRGNVGQQDLFPNVIPDGSGDTSSLFIVV